MISSLDYSKTADELAKHILKLIPNNPKLLTMTDPWDLFNIKGFKCSGLNPSLFQAGWALKKAQKLYNEKTE